MARHPAGGVPAVPHRPGVPGRLAAGSGQIRAATRDRLQRQLAAGVLRDDVDVEVIASYLELVLEGLMSHLAEGLPTDRLPEVLDVVERSVRRPPSVDRDQAG